MLKETEAAKPTVSRNGALPLARFGLGVGRVEFWISTRVENSAIFVNDFTLSTRVTNGLEKEFKTS